VAYNAYNFSNDATHPTNITLAGVGISSLWCPSDPTATTSLNLSTPLTGYYPTVGASLGYAMPPGTWYQQMRSYANVFGPICDLGGGAMGVIKSDGMVTRIAGITDGTSNTLLFTEVAIGSVPQSTGDYNEWNLRDTEVDSQYAPNPRRYTPQSGYTGIRYENTAASMHPGGVNCSFADGSVRFIKDSISSWPNSPPLYGAPPSYYTETFNIVSFSPFVVTENVTWTAAAKLGVWQALSTRAGGEVISSDSY
jgi:prepilin-type processing-associated H-X9-DG protein